MSESCRSGAHDQLVRLLVRWVDYYCPPDRVATPVLLIGHLPKLKSSNQAGELFFRQDIGGACFEQAERCRRISPMPRSSG
jgi:hypothetical protein